mmetsp:Transcript_24666/g.60655  ORF Transcript_24666/g.60655 Transcript_24666/m.60655 type:complete len:219 (-) Transcript_24666:503-1159(-)
MALASLSSAAFSAWLTLMISRSRSEMRFSCWLTKVSLSARGLGRMFPLWMVSQSNCENHGCALMSTARWRRFPSRFADRRSMKRSMMSTANSETYTGNDTVHERSTMRFITVSGSSGLPFTIWLKGCCPVSSTYIITPSPHQSIDVPYPRASTTSGATYPGVPQNVYVCPPFSSFFANPKSPSLAVPSVDSSTFSGLRSRYTMELSCRYSNAKVTTAM